MNSEKKSRWPFIIAIVSIVISVISTATGESATSISDSLATLGGFGLFVSAIWYFIARIRRNGWRMLDKIVLWTIGILFLIAVVSIASL